MTLAPQIDITQLSINSKNTRCELANQIEVVCRIKPTSSFRKHTTVPQSVRHERKARNQSNKHQFHAERQPVSIVLTLRSMSSILLMINWSPHRNTTSMMKKPLLNPTQIDRAKPDIGSEFTVYAGIPPSTTRAEPVRQRASRDEEMPQTGMVWVS